jgi:hypothetical protein
LPRLRIPYAVLPAVSILPASETETVFVPPVVSIPSLTPVVTNAPVTVTVSLPFIVFPSLVVVPDVITKSSAITGAAKARQTKADVPSRRDLRCFKFILLAWSGGCMASVLKGEIKKMKHTIENVSGSVSKNGNLIPTFGTHFFYGS